MKGHIYELTLCLGMLFCIPLAGMSQDTLSYLDPDVLTKLDNAEREGRPQYIKNINAYKYIGVWVAETNGYVCRLEFTKDTMRIDYNTHEILLGKYRLTKGDTVILDNMGMSGRPDFCILGWESISGIDFNVSARKLLGMHGNMHLLNFLTADSARITFEKNKGIWIVKRNQPQSVRDKTQAALLKFFSPGIVFTKLNTHTE